MNWENLRSFREWVFVSTTLMTKENNRITDNQSAAVRPKPFMAESFLWK
jgi:hypothetical protein